MTHEMQLSSGSPFVALSSPAVFLEPQDVIHACALKGERTQKGGCAVAFCEERSRGDLGQSGLPGGRPLFYPLTGIVGFLVRSRGFCGWRVCSWEAALGIQLFSMPRTR